MLRALALKNVNAILFYHSKTLLYQYTIPFYNSFTSKNSTFIKILFFNQFFIISSHPTVQPHFPGLFNNHFYFSLPTPVQHTTHTHYTPINHPNPSPHPHTHKHIHQPSNKATHKHNPATKPSHTQTQTHSKTRSPIKNPGQATDPRCRSTNPHRRFETQATDQKSEQTHSKKIITGANPFKKHHHQSHQSKPIQTHSKKFITRANPFKPIQKTSSLEPRSKPIQ